MTKPDPRLSALMPVAFYSSPRFDIGVIAEKITVVGQCAFVYGIPDILHYSGLNLGQGST